MIRKLMGTTALAALALAAAGTAAQAQTAPQRFSNVVVFGDSLSDPGNLAQFGQAPPAPYVGGRFSNGPVWAEQLSPLLGGTPVVSRAFGGARSTAERPIDVQSQVSAQLAATPALNPNGLYAVWIGANDYFQFFSAPTADPTAFARGVATNAGTAATRLMAAGARNVLLFNLPNLGDTPGGRANGPAASGQANQITLLHNAFISQTARDIQAATPGSRVIVVDINTLSAAFNANPAAYGFSNTTVPCFTGTALTGACATPAGAAGTTFFDPIHPTTATHAVIAQFTAGTVAAVVNGPEGIAAQPELGLIMHENATGAVTARLAGARSGTGMLGLTSAQAGEDGRFGIFLYGNYAEGDRDPISGRAGFDYDGYTLAIGADYRVDDNVMAGMSFGYGDATQDLDFNAGDASLQAYTLTGYVSTAFDGFHADGTLSFSFDDYDRIRRATFLAAAPTGTASTHGNTYGAALNTGYTFGTESVGVGPVAGLRYINTEVDGYTEDGAGPLALTVQQTNAESLVGSIGAQVTGRFGGDTAIAPYASLAYEHEFLGDARRVFATLAGGQRAEADPQAGKRGSVVGGFGLSVGTDEAQATFGYEGTVANKDRQDHAFMARIRAGF
ncbi:MAG TPA: autotransporter domain-containing protein [Azospirillaceae bacterium]|nr:autotransporter domain-containing protein [Azospirillaceae bacterium]